MLIDFGADRELGHLQGGTDDVIDVPDVDLPGHVQLSASAAFHNVPSRIALFRIDRENGTGFVSIMCVKNWSRRYQLSIKRGMSILVKKPAKS